MSVNVFLDSFMEKVKKLSKRANQASWILETTGSKDAATLKAELEIELLMLFNDRSIYEKLKAWDEDTSVTDPLIRRQLNILIRRFIPNLVDKSLIEKISIEEANLSLLYSNFRPEIEGKSFTENEIREVLKKENDVELRKEVWEASKQIGPALAPSILKLVKLRNQAAVSLGYPNYFSMQLKLQEVDEKWLFSLLDKLAEDSDPAYEKIFSEISRSQSGRFGVPESELGPWAWSEPFCQEDPLDSKALDELVSGLDILEAAKKYYQTMGFDVSGTISRSDNFERPGKNQHAFCMDVDREGDVRMLNNIKPTIKWLETTLHELGHAVYDLGYNSSLPWILKEPPHMITTEAMALVMGRQAYRQDSLNILNENAAVDLRSKAEESLRRRQLIFSRWVLVMTYFERELYANPDQDLNTLWWKLVKRFQKIQSEGSSSQYDWAAKYHVGLAPVYYYSYLLGELFASSLETMTAKFASAETGDRLKEKAFLGGNSTDWHSLVRNVTGTDLCGKAWLTQFAKCR